MSIRKGQYFIAGMPSKITRSVGQIIQSIVPLDDLELRLLDGSIISGDGIYSDFVNYIKSLMTEYPHFFVSESDWQNYVNRDGVCARFVYNTTNNTLRLPKITGFIEGTNSTNDLGNLINAGLPNITGTFAGLRTEGGTTGTGVFQNNGNYNGYASANGSATNNSLSFDASRSSSIYGNSNTVQPQSIKVLYYVVVANSTKTDFTIDIDKVEDRLNTKANDNIVVHKNENETITSLKTIQITDDNKNLVDSLYIKNPNLTADTMLDTGDNGRCITFTDKNNVALGYLEFYSFGLDSESGAKRYMAINACKGGKSKAQISIGFDESENIYTTAPACDMNGSIVTTVNKSKASNGYFKLGNGLIIQWGITPNIGGNGTVCTLPIAFTTTNYSVTAITSGTFNENSIGLTGKTTTTFTLVERGYDGGWHNVPNYFIAIGF